MSLLSKIFAPKTGRPAAKGQKPGAKSVYRPLSASQSSTRLIQIQPSDDHSAPMCCTMSESKFGDIPQYEALSYRWGDSPVKYHIFVNGQDFEVTQNLFNALHFLRRRAGSGATELRYWIDAICINQGDEEEKNQQIRIMPDIYFRAETVLVWLGNKSELLDVGGTQRSKP